MSACVRLPKTALVDGYPEHTQLNKSYCQFSEVVIKFSRDGNGNFAGRLWLKRSVRSPSMLLEWGLSGLEERGTEDAHSF